MLRWLQNRELREKEATLRYAESVITSLESKNAELQQRVDALRSSLKIEREARQYEHST